MTTGEYREYLHNLSIDEFEEEYLSLRDVENNVNGMTLENYGKFQIMASYCRENEEEE